MKRYLLGILTLAAIFFGGCKKSADVAAPKSDTFFPVIAGSSWTYIDAQQDLANDTATSKVTGATTVFNNKTYYNIATSSKNKGLGTDYFYSANHVFVMRSLNAYAGTTVDLQLYNDTATIGAGHISIPTDDGMVNNLPVQTVNTIIAKDIPLQVNGIHYTDVVHTRIEFQYDYKTGSGFQTNFIYDFYLAKNIGIIAYNLNIAGNVAEQEVLLNYSPK